MKIRWTVPLFKIPVFLYIGEEERKRFYKDKELDPEKDEALGKAYGIQQDDSVFIYDLQDASVAVHEFTHLTNDIMKYLGLEGEEVAAYIMQWLSGKYFELMRKHGSRI